MKKHWVIFNILLVMMILTGGVWFGINIESSRVHKNQQYSENIQDKIAIINQDIGALNDGVKENYSVEIINKLGDNYVLTSTQEAQSGYDKGAYCAIITFPSKLSSNVVSINETKPEKVNLSYVINSNLQEDAYIDTYKNILDLQNEVNQMISYMYVYSIYDEVHTAQNKINSIFQNDEDDMGALQEVKLSNFTENLNLGDIPNPPLDTKKLDFNSFVEQVKGNADNISKEYMDSYAKAKEDYKVFGNNLINFAQTIDKESSVWKENMTQWETQVTDFDKKVITYGNDINNWADIVEDWNKANKEWYDELTAYKEKAEELKGLIEKAKTDSETFVEKSNQWVTDAETWSNQILESQSNRETSIIEALENYNKNYENLNIQLTDLQNWGNNIQLHIDKLKTDSENIADKIDQWETDTETWSNQILESQSNREQIVIDALNDYDDNYEKINIYNEALKEWSNSLQLYVDSSFVGDVPKLVLPVGFKEPEELTSVASWTTEIFDECPKIDNEDFNAFTTVLTNPPELEQSPDFETPQELNPVEDWVTEIFNECPKIKNDVQPFSGEINNPPEFSGETTLPNVPDKPEKSELQIPAQSQQLVGAISDIVTKTHDYSPENYLTSDVRSSIYKYVDEYSDNVFNTKKELDNNVEGNIELLETAYKEYNKYVSDLKTEAVECNDTEQENLQVGLSKFYNAKTETSNENKKLLGTFSAMMPNSRIDSMLNKNVVEFTIAPVNFIDTNVRVKETGSNISKKNLLDKLQIIMISLLILSCFTLSWMLFSYLFRKKKQDTDNIVAKNV